MWRPATALFLCLPRRQQRLVWVLAASHSLATRHTQAALSTRYRWPFNRHFTLSARTMARRLQRSRQRNREWSSSRRGVGRHDNLAMLIAVSPACTLRHFAAGADFVGFAVAPMWVSATATTTTNKLCHIAFGYNCRSQAATSSPKCQAACAASFPYSASCHLLHFCCAATATL